MIDMGKKVVGVCPKCRTIVAVESSIEDTEQRWQRVSKKRPPDETWCWVATDDGRVFIAKASASYAGGWGNEDTWEDFDGEVVAWLPIPFPPER